MSTTITLPFSCPLDDTPLVVTVHADTADVEGPECEHDHSAYPQYAREAAQLMFEFMCGSYAFQTWCITQALKIAEVPA